MWDGLPRNKGIVKVVPGAQSSRVVTAALASSLVSEPVAKAPGWVDLKNHPFTSAFLVFRFFVF